MQILLRTFFKRWIAVAPARFARCQIALLFCLLMSLGQAAHAEFPEVDPRKFESFMVGFLDGRVTGYAFALVSREGRVVEKAGGWAQRAGDGNRRFDVRTLSAIGSVSKLITGTAVMHALRENPVTDGTVNEQLDEPILKFLPNGLATAYRQQLSGITLKHLLQHKSGLRGYSGDRFTIPAGFRDLEAIMRAGTARTPGSKREYNNHNISLMRFILPKIAEPQQTALLDQFHSDKTGREYFEAVLRDYNGLYKDYMYEEFFPVVFGNARIPSCNPHDEAGPGSYARSYRNTNDTEGEDLRPGHCAPQGSFYFSIRQMTKFADALGYGNSLVSNGIRKRMERPDTINDRLIYNKVVTTDLFAGETARRDWVFHGGTIEDYRAAFVRLPNGHYGMALTNSPRWTSDQLANAMVHAFAHATVGLPAKYLSANDEYHFAYRPGLYVSAGDSKDHDLSRAPYFGTLGSDQTYDGLLDISANNRLRFAWFASGPDLRVMRGSSNDLDSDRTRYDSQIDPRFFISQVKFISSNDDKHFAWYDTGGNLWVSSGPSTNLGKNPAVAVSLPAGKKPHQILAIVSNNRQHFAYYDDCTYSSGTSTNLGSSYVDRPYDCRDLGH